MRSPDRSGRGLFITFEGVEGSGKSTQIERLARRLVDDGHPVVTTREPGGTVLGERLRSLLLDTGGAPMGPVVELLLYAADRAQHIDELIRPALDREEIVLCDRYLDATLAYQGYGRDLGIEVILALHSRPPLDLRPDRTILLDLDPAAAVDRARRRNAELGLTRSEGRFEAEEPEFHRRVRDGYLELAGREPDRFRIVPAGGDPDRIHLAVREAVADLLPIEGEEGA
jgi:dTMP kinase